ncbi:MAG: Flp family type IVb pilin [Pseudomonadota bacterium]
MSNWSKTCLARVLNNDSGATAIEYALIAGIIALGIIVGVTAVSGELQGIFTDIGQAFTNILG